MKKIKVVFLALVFTNLFLSCSSDDNSGGTDEPIPVIGTWNLVELNISPAQDIDEDGNASANILDELNCVSGTLVINEVGTWSLSLDGVTITTITGGQFDIRCSTTSGFNSGTWAFQNNQLTLFQGVEPIVLTLANDRLTNLIGESLPELFSEVYQKQ